MVKAKLWRIEYRFNSGQPYHYTTHIISFSSSGAENVISQYLKGKPFDIIEKRAVCDVDGYAEEFALQFTKEFLDKTKEKRKHKGSDYAYKPIFFTDMLD